MTILMRWREYLLCYAKGEICTAPIVILVVEWIRNLTMLVSLPSVRLCTLTSTIHYIFFLT
jgi:hypothetical protein